MYTGGPETSHSGVRTHSGVLRTTRKSEGVASRALLVPVVDTHEHSREKKKPREGKILHLSDQGDNIGEPAWDKEEQQEGSVKRNQDTQRKEEEAP